MGAVAEEETSEKQFEQPLYQSDFPNQLGTWQDVVGKADKTSNSNGLTITNTKQGTSLESVSLNKDAGEQSSGDLELTFLYEGQANIGLVFELTISKQVNGSHSRIIGMANGNLVSQEENGSRLFRGRH